MAHDKMFDETDDFLARVRELALALPETEEKVSHGRPTFRCGRIFLIFGGGVKVSPGIHEQHERSMIFLPSVDERLPLEQDTRTYVPAYYGPSGWLGIDLPDLDEAGPWAEITELVETSYRQIAPRRALRVLDERASA